ncbi:hypothetical protein VDIAB_100128 [Vibrio diabolicus]|nr:hypothetical protein VDIAB_100128 [Vibrio diabolicus]
MGEYCIDYRQLSEIIVLSMLKVRGTYKNLDILIFYWLSRHTSICCGLLRRLEPLRSNQCLERIWTDNDDLKREVR